MVQFPSRSHAPAGETRERILAVAARSFREKGFTATTTRELAAASGIQPGSLYYYVKDKEQLLFELCQLSLDDAISSLKAATRSIREPEQRLRTLVTTHLSILHRDSNRFAVAFLEMRALQGPHQKKILEKRDEYEALVREVIEAGQAEGFLRDDLPAKHLTLNLLGLLNWTVFWYKADEPSEEALSLPELCEVVLSICSLGLLRAQK